MHTLKCMAYAWRPTNSYYSLVAIQAPVLLSQEKVHARVAVPIKAHVLLVRSTDISRGCHECLGHLFL